MRHKIWLFLFFLIFSVIALGQTEQDILTMDDGHVYYGKLDSVTQHIVYFSEYKIYMFEIKHESHGFNKSLVDNIQLSNGTILTYKTEQINENLDVKNSENFNSMASSLQGMFIFQVIFFIGTIIGLIVSLGT